MNKRSALSYAKQSFKTYEQKYEAALKAAKQGLRAKIKEEAYTETYLRAKEFGFSTKNFSSQQLAAGSIFNRQEALNMVNNILKNCDEATLNLLGLDVEYNKNGTISKNYLVEQIQAFSSDDAQTFTTLAIDLGIINSGAEEYDAYVY